MPEAVIAPSVPPHNSRSDWVLVGFTRHLLFLAKLFKPSLLPCGESCNKIPFNVKQSFNYKNQCYIIETPFARKHLKNLINPLLSPFYL